MNHMDLYLHILRHALIKTELAYLLFPIFDLDPEPRLLCGMATLTVSCLLLLSDCHPLCLSASPSLLILNWENME